MKRVACYERVSTEEQALKGFSIEAQIDNLTDYCQKQGYKLVGHYTDEGISGAKPASKRPAMNALLNDVSAGKIDLILFTKLDRWFRNVPEYFKTQSILDEYKVEWDAIHEDYDTTTANGKLAVTIFLAVAQNERDRTSERIKVVLEHKRRNKEYCYGGTCVPYGYRRETDASGKIRLVKDEEKEVAVADFWQTLMSDYNLTKTANRMLEVYGIDRRYDSWLYMTNNEVYTGTVKGIQGFCEPYVAREDWEKYRKGNKVKHVPSGETYIFRKLIRCNVCGKSWSGSQYKKPYGVYVTYACSDKRNCKARQSLSELKIEKQLLTNLRMFAENELMTIERETKQMQAQTPLPAAKKLDELKERKRRLTIVYLAGNISDADYKEADAALSVQIHAAQTTINAAPTPRDPAPIKALLASNFEATYTTLTKEEKQAFWRTTLKEIIITNRQVSGVIFL